LATAAAASAAVTKKRVTVKLLRCSPREHRPTAAAARQVSPRDILQVAIVIIIIIIVNNVVG